MGFFDKRKDRRGQQHVDYWLDDRRFNLVDKGATTIEILKLAAIKRAIGNFVRIVTNKAIPVRFSSGEQSYTDGEVVTISASTQEKNYDSVVGLALHEGTHCAETNFEFNRHLANIWKKAIPESLRKLGEARGLKEDKMELVGVLHRIMNVVEDRRIDYIMYRTAPGYRPYYEAMYDTYFRNAQIDRALQECVWNRPTVENYLNHLMNTSNRWFDTSALPDLDLIYGLMDLDNISRLKSNDEGYDYANRQARLSASTYDFEQMPELFRVSCKILAVILKNSEYSHQLDLSDMDLTPGEGDEGEEEQDNEGSGWGETDEQELQDQVEQDLDIKSGARKVCRPASGKKMSGKVNEKRLQKALDTQRDFVDGKVPKQNIDETTAQQVKAIEQSGAKQIDVDFEDEWSGTSSTRVIVMKHFTHEILVSGAFPFTSGYDSGSGDGTITPHQNVNAANAIHDGFRLGRALAHKLQIRNQSQITRFNRREKGHIDKKRLHALGHDDENVFYITRKTAYEPVHVHLTIDGSGSMWGEKFKEALQVGIALAVAADTIENLDVVMSIRAGVDDYAAICIIYDSKTDDLSKIRTLFPFLCTAGSTPEGLCFQAILDILTESKATEKYFVNLSDGQPAYAGYSGRWAWNHTRDQVNYLRTNGLKILSYYIGGSRERAHEGFRIMYGKDASFINVNQIPGLVSTLNKLFLTR